MSDQSLLAKWVKSEHAKESEKKSVFQVNFILNHIMIRCYHAPPGCDPSYKLREFYSSKSIEQLESTLGIFGPHFDFTVKAGITTFLLRDFTSHSNNNFLMTSMEHYFLSVKEFKDCNELKETYRKFFSSTLIVNRAKKLCRDTAASMIKAWISILLFRPDRIIHNSLKCCKINENTANSSNVVFNMKQL